MRLWILVAAFASFTAYTLYVMAGNGLLGFLSLAGREPWGMQLLVDLFVMLVLFAAWVRRDARERGLPDWPWVALVLVMGSMGALAYLVHRELAQRRRGGATPSAP